MQGVAFGGSLHSAENISAADYNGYLHSGLDDSLNLGGIFSQTHGIDAVMLLPHEGFTAEFEKDSLVFCSHSLKYLKYK